MAEIQWELDGGGGSPGTADSLYLVRSEDGYYFTQVQDGECIIDPVEANDDEAAIAIACLKRLPSRDHDRDPPHQG